jgi:hypothetical protein
MFRQVNRAILPQLSLKQTVEGWQSIAAGLSESRRTRKRQQEIFSKTS